MLSWTQQLGNGRKNFNLPSPFLMTWRAETSNSSYYEGLRNLHMRILILKPSYDGASERAARNMKSKVYREDKGSAISSS